MNNLDQTPTNSLLSQSLTRDGKTVSIEIYDNGEGGWLLEVVDEYGNSTVWNDAFESDREALDEAVNTINKDGIDSLIGPRPDAKVLNPLGQPLSQLELEELDNFLGDADLIDTAMDVSTLDGFLTAIAVGPQIVLASEWMSWIWDMEEGSAKPTFMDEKQANRIMSLIMRHYNSVIGASNTYPASFEPLFWRDACWGAAEWCEGFLLGFQFDPQAWSQLAVAHPSWLTPFLRLGTEDGKMFTETAQDADKWINEIEPSLTKIHGYLQSHRGNQRSWDHQPKNETGTIVREGQKIGRNAPCSCGSGKKFKKCCGVSNNPPTIH